MSSKVTKSSCYKNVKVMKKLIIKVKSLVPSKSLMHGQPVSLPLTQHRALRMTAANAGLQRGFNKKKSSQLKKIEIFENS